MIGSSTGFGEGGYGWANCGLLCGPSCFVFVFLCLSGTRRVQLTRPPLTSVRFPASYCDNRDVLLWGHLYSKPHFSTPFFVSVWYKGLVVQFEQKSRDIDKAETSTKPRCRSFARMRSLLPFKCIKFKSVYLARGQ